MILSFSQPAFLPWGGFFCRLMAADRMVLLDDTLFARGFTFVNRNRLKGLQGEVWITVPIMKSGRGRQKIKDLEIYQKYFWGRKFLATLDHLYGKSLYFNELTDPLVKIIQNQDNSFLNMAVSMLESLKENLGINTPFILQSDTGIEDKGTPLLVKIAQKVAAREVIFPYPAQSLVDRGQFKEVGIGIKFLKFEHPLYPQFRGDFISCLSVLDLLFSLGKDSRRLLAQSFITVDS